MASQKQYKVKLTSGRVLGPIGLDRIRLLILKNHVTGQESAREYPQGEWADINSFPPIADLLVKKALGTLNSEPTQQATRTQSPPLGETQVLDPGATVPLPSKTTLQNREQDEKKDPLAATKTAVQPQKKRPLPTSAPTTESSDEKTSAGFEEDEKTVVAIPNENSQSSLASVNLEFGDDEKTDMFQNKKGKRSKLPALRNLDGSPMESGQGDFRSNVSDQETIMFERPFGGDDWGIKDALKDPRKMNKAIQNTVKNTRKNVVGVLATLSIVFVIYNLIDMGDSSQEGDKSALWKPVRAVIPQFDMSQKDPSKSAKYYTEAMKFYILDNVVGYKKAAELLTLAVQYDHTNVKALAILASCYLNLIDSSNKDENYFNVISKLIELSRANHIDLPETVISDVEFYIAVNKAEAAQNRIVEYTKTQVKFDTVMFYYLALAFYYRGDSQSAVRYISEYPENKAFSPKLFYLRGQIAEKLGDSTAALQEYEKAIKMSPSHAKSRLAIANIMDRTGQLQSAGAHLEYIAKNPHLLAPRDLAQAYYLHAKLGESFGKDKLALSDLVKAARLEPDNHDYLLDLYSLEAKLGQDVKQSRGMARMYFFLGEGEKNLKVGQYHEALTHFLQALQAEDKSPLPFVKIGDMYRHMNDLNKAMDSYQKAAQRAPNNIDVWSKYIDTLIQSYEWQKAIEAMERFRKLDVPQSALDKAAADMYFKQGDLQQAVQYYQKAMSRESVDSGVYIAYAKILMESKNFKEAPFFFALAMRFDPLNVEALIGTAKCIAATESIDRAISFLEDELKKGTVAKSELLAAIAEFYLQKGSEAQADEFVTQALAANPTYAYPYKVRGKIYLAKENEKGALDKALDAFKSYSDRNPSDPSGYLERYRIFIKKSEFEKADDELMKIYNIYPKYPNLHFYKGALYSMMGNLQKAIDEYSDELKNNPNNVATLIAMGKELVKSGQAVQAINYLNKAMELSPKSAEAKAEGAYASYLLKNFAGSVALFNAAIRLDPGNAMLYKRLGNTFRDAGDRRSAAQAYRRYLELNPDAPDRGELESFR